MSRTTKDSPPRAPVLNEFEIQKRLYGQYVKDPSEGSAVEWTGAEILAGELKRLRDELIVLRKEREDLEKRLQQKSEVSLSTGISFRSRPVPQRPGVRILGVLGKFFFLLAVVTVLLYPVGVQLLQASPNLLPEPAPYTVQVAVYDVKSSADQALSYLQELGYPAFLVESSRRRDGRPRYRIYVGQYVTKQEASLEKAKLTGDKNFSDAFVRFP